MTGYFTVNGTSCEDFNLIVSNKGVYGIAERDVKMTSIPGRNGELLIDNGRYENVSMSYPAICLGDFDRNYSAFMGFIMAQEGYLRIEDTFHPDEFVLARYKGDTDPKRVTLDDKGTFIMKFERKPQRWLKSGEKAITLTSNGVIKNNEYMTALPLIRAYGTGSISIGADTITINSADVYTDIDCDTQNAFKGATNCNGNIVLNTGRFFSLKSGINNVTLSGITRIEVIPRWWKL